MILIINHFPVVTALTKRQDNVDLLPGISNNRSSFFEDRNPVLAMLSLTIAIFELNTA